MVPQAPRQGESRLGSSRTTAVSSDMPTAETQPQPTHYLVHHDAANAANENMAVDAQLNIVRKIGCSEIMK